MPTDPDRPPAAGSRLPASPRLTAPPGLPPAGHLLAPGLCRAGPAAAALAQGAGGACAAQPSRGEGRAAKRARGRRKLEAGGGGRVFRSQDGGRRRRRAGSGGRPRPRAAPGAGLGEAAARRGSPCPRSGAARALPAPPLAAAAPVASGRGGEAERSGPGGAVVRRHLPGGGRVTAAGSGAGGPRPAPARPRGEEGSPPARVAVWPGGGYPRAICEEASGLSGVPQTFWGVRVPPARSPGGVRG